MKTQTTNEATARPWRIGDAGRTVFGPPNGNPSPETVATTTRANAALIAQAVNEHAALLAVARWAEDALSRLTVLGYGHIELTKAFDQLAAVRGKAVSK